MNQVMYCEHCGKMCYMFFSKRCKNCGSKMKLLSEELKYKYHIFVDDWGEISREEIISRKEKFVMEELINNPLFSIEEYKKQVQNQRLINKEIEEYYQEQALEQQNKINKQTQKILDQQNCVPKCPICGSSNVSKIGVVNRAVSTGLFGLASSKIGKTHKCNNCGTTW